MNRARPGLRVLLALSRQLAVLAGATPATPATGARSGTAGRAAGMPQASSPGPSSTGWSRPRSPPAAWGATSCTGTSALAAGDAGVPGGRLGHGGRRGGEVAGLVGPWPYRPGRAERGDPDPRPRPELLRAAKWRAARHGLEADLVDVLAGTARPAAELVEAFLAEVGPALEEAGDLEEVTGLVQATLAGGPGAARQRAAFRRTGRLEDVVDLVVEATAR